MSKLIKYPVMYDSMGLNWSGWMMKSKYIIQWDDEYDCYCGQSPRFFGTTFYGDTYEIVKSYLDIAIIGWSNLITGNI